jgi:predicted dehydrogenase
MSYRVANPKSGAGALYTRRSAVSGFKNRREFLADSALAGAGFWVAGGLAAADTKSPNEKLNIACIGVGGKGSSDVDHCGELANVVALCDIDDRTLNQKAEKFPQAKKYHDYRKMLEEMNKQIDAVTVSTPDHTHAPASIMAMRMGKHVYCQKPLTHTVYEARLMRETAAKFKVATQMGNQGTAENGLRRAVEIIRAGVIGPVREVHVWTNRPIWPQGADAILRVGSARTAALAALHGSSPGSPQPASVPGYVHWDLFLGTAPERPYDPIYHPFSWRGWWDFGTGALGDMACHTANMAFMALKLGYPTRITAESGEINPETYPDWARIQFEFPAREEMPPVKFVWYEGHQGGRRVLPPAKLTQGQTVTDSGSLLVGDKGVLYSPNDYGAAYKLLPEKDFAGYQGPAESLPRNGKGDLGMKQEWIEAIRGGPPALSNFQYAGMLTETILLGNLAMRAGKPVEVEQQQGRRRRRVTARKIEWDGPNMRATNAPEAEQYIRPEYRKGFVLS